MNFIAPQKPKLSIVICSFNTGKFVKDTLDSLLRQTSKDFEIIVFDGASTDDTLKILNEYSGLGIISEPDKGFWDAFYKGVNLARGEYIMQCCISDGLLDPDWIGDCIKVLDNNKDVSLVWGLQQQMSEGGTLGEILYPQFHHEDPPQKTEFFYYWLSVASSGFVLPEPNYVIRKNVLKKCLPKFEIKLKNAIDPFMEISYHFFKNGYSPYFLRRVANYARLHEGNLTSIKANNGIGRQAIFSYKNQCIKFRREILLSPTKYVFRDGNGDPTGISFSRWHFISSYFINPKEILKKIISFPKPYIRAFLNFLIRNKIISPKAIELLKNKFLWLRTFCGAYW